ncbi:hypothetical protein HaLaN_20119 [Haematococcus lacustris]|uniref:Uncharacterized protein n=1 Tax=Haematococcus lacustris TaxID=44745 RepID=A0A699ZKS2_HAELA|nr:hypothetical protein HaLaN_20119 [Haematococcus lacustris]
MVKMGQKVVRLMVQGEYYLACPISNAPVECGATAGSGKHVP